jgi:hypothetical protein
LRDKCANAGAEPSDQSPRAAAVVRCARILVVTEVARILVVTEIARILVVTEVARILVVTEVARILVVTEVARILVVTEVAFAWTGLRGVAAFDLMFNGCGLERRYTTGSSLEDHPHSQGSVFVRCPFRKLKHSSTYV